LEIAQGNPGKLMEINEKKKWRTQGILTKNASLNF
jgi:hypothetical protein